MEAVRRENGSVAPYGQVSSLAAISRVLSSTWRYCGGDS